jgi:hypothetical protein
MKTIIAVLTVGLGLFVGWYFWGDELSAMQNARELNKSAQTNNTATKSGEWKSVSVQTSAGPKRIMTRSVNADLASARQLLTASKDLAALQRELDTATNINLVDRKFYQAAIEDYCFGVAIRNGWISPPDPQKFNGLHEQSLVLEQGGTPLTSPQSQPDDPKFQIRTASKTKLLENSAASRCAGFKNRPISLASVDAKMKEAAALGDKRSAGLLASWGIIDGITQTEMMVSSSFTPGDTKRPFLVNVINPPTAEQVGQITAAISTGDPVAILSLGHTLTQSYERSEFYFGDKAESLELKLRDYIWPMLACEFGANCSAGTNQILLTACANEGVCDVPDLETYMKSYKLNERELAQYERLKPQFLNAINTGNWGFMSTTPGPLTPGTIRYMYKNGMRIPVRFGW